MTSQRPASPSAEPSRTPRFRWTLARKYTLAALVVGVIPASIVGAIALQATNGIQTRVGEQLSSAAVGLADRVDRNIFERYGDVQAFAGRAASIIDDKAALEAAMNQFVQLYGVYALTVAVDPAGVAIAVNTKDPLGRPVRSAALVGKSYADTEWFRAVSAGKFTTSQPFAAAANRTASGTYVHDAHVDPDLKAVFPGESPLALGFAAPILRDGVVVGYWMNTARLSIIDEIVSAGRAELAAAGFPTAEVTVLDEVGAVLTSSSGADAGGAAERFKANNQVSLGFETAKRAVAGETGHGEFRPAGSAEMQVAGFAHLSGALGFSGMNWAIVVNVAEKEAYATARSLATQIQVAVVGSSLLVVILALFVAPRFTRPITTMAEAAGRIAEGRLDVQVHHRSTDELGDLAASFRVMIERLSSAFRTIQGSAGQVANSSSELSSASRNLADVATSSAASIQQIGASSGEVARRTEETATRVETTRSLAQSIRQSAERGDHQMQDMLKAISEVDASAHNISKVIKVIDDISFQINLLSLNAAVEAARAGEHGRGFAVVAEEVRNLATRSARAARETGGLIEGSISKARFSSEIAQETARALGEIVDGIQRMAALADEVAGAAKDQARAVAEINLGIGSVDDAVQSTTASAEEMAATATELSSQSDELRHVVRQFRLPAQAAAARPSAFQGAMAAHEPRSAAQAPARPAPPAAAAMRRDSSPAHRPGPSGDHAWDDVDDDSEAGFGPH